MQHRILVSDPLEKTGLTQLRASGHDVVELPAEQKDQLQEKIGDFDALVVRSGTQVTADLLRAGKNRGAGRLRVVGRAGIGVDNVDTRAATELGILVVNAPTANLISACEHTFALLLALARKVAAADADIKREAWNRKNFVGVELQGKTLGVIGFGRIGQQVARRAQAFDMDVLAYDPFLPDDVVAQHDATPLPLDELLQQADVVTLHVPLTDDTRDLLSGDRLRKMKQGALLINCARGGVVDETTLLELLESGHIAGAGLDVFAAEPPSDWELAAHPKVVATPHVGAQTREAQVRISTQTAKMVLAALEGSLAVTAVNLPFRPAGAAGAPFLHLAETLGHLAGCLGDGGLRSLEVVFRGIEDDLQRPATVAAVKGVLQRQLGDAVNYVNAETLATERGVEVRRSTSAKDLGYPNLLTLSLAGDEGSIDISGTIFHGSEARVVEIEGYPLEFRPKGDLLIVRNRDVPGVVGNLGSILGEAGLNIAEIHLARRPGSEQALAIVRLDQQPEANVIDRLQSLPEVQWALTVHLRDS
ncbi:MAG: phosphoglycerate dehydrogenase [Thermoanaerobaculia bacterium]|nr:phosphoglycerate dehydrogenase [Thermoanaerobaculia bacterium]